MARKRSASGRARPKTLENTLRITVEKVNRRLNKLDQGKVYGRYASKKILRLANADKNILYSRKRRNKITISTKGLTQSELRIYQKQMESFLRSNTSSVRGVKQTQANVIEKVRKSLSGMTDLELTNDDVEDFFYLTSKDNDFKYLADRMDPSKLYILMQHTKEGDGTGENFISMLENYMTVNNQNVRKKATRLYNKFVSL